MDLTVRVCDVCHVPTRDTRRWVVGLQASGEPAVRDLCATHERPLLALIERPDTSQGARATGSPRTRRSPSRETRMLTVEEVDALKRK